MKYAVLVLLGLVLSSYAGAESPASLEAALQSAATQQRLGRYPAALETLERALTLAGEDNARRASLLSQLGMIYLAVGRLDEADQASADGLALIGGIDDARRRAGILNNRGNVLLRRQRYTEALQAYDESALLAEQSGDAGAYASVLGNRVRAEAAGGGDVLAALDLALSANRALSDGYDKGFNFLTLGYLAADAGQTARAFEAYRAAQALGERLERPRLRSFALGYMADLYATAGRHDEAWQLLQQALFLAQQAQSPELIYRWQWNTGRSLVKQGRLIEAVDAYRRAVATVQPIRSALASGLQPTPLEFRRDVGRLYYELAGLLLQQAETVNSSEQTEDLLRQARAVVELFKAAELQDYFQDDCVAELQARTAGIDMLGYGTAVLYPIILPERLVLLLTLPDGIRQYPVPVSEDQLNLTVGLFRGNLTNRLRRAYFYQARQLYRWLIEPVEAVLNNQGIRTLVVVPDGSLRSIPWAALHDGKVFLVERFALATTPGLTLTDPRGLDREDPRALLNGLSQSVQNFSPLPSVEDELSELQTLFGKSSVLHNNNFVIDKLQDRLQQASYDIVHIASHGLFDPDPKKSFLLTYDGRLTMNRLERLLAPTRFRDKPVELLTLSACETAVGNDRASLGLAGLAIKAGARSALASLWFVDDKATSELMVEFYRRLREPGFSKADALRQAQLALTEKNRLYRHPAYWAPFLLIGNWL